MSARLFCKTGELAGAAYTIDREATIGRLQENEITLHPTFISGHHARIYFDADEAHYFLEDLGSSNGTKLDGMDIKEATRLDRLHVLTFAGQFDFIFQVLPRSPVERAAPGEASRDQGEKTRFGDAFDVLPPLAVEEAHDGVDKTRFGDPFGDLPPILEEAAPADKTSIGDVFQPLPPLPPEGPVPGEDETLFVPPSDQPEEPVPSVEPVQPVTPVRAGPFVVEITMPEGTREVFPLKEGTNRVGRQSTADVPVPHPSISRNHAVLTVREGKVLLKDSGSKNATYVQGEKLTSEIEILPGIPIRFGFNIEAILRREEPHP
ncbi:MAG: FHA domain-containing protein [Rhodothermales bacterium]